MDNLIINGQRKLKGEVNISAAKNSVLPIIAASLLATEEVTIINAPMLDDVFTLCNVIEELGFNISINKLCNTIKIKEGSSLKICPNEDLVRKMRASFLIMGPMLSKYGEFRLTRPGGCNIGNRPIDLHLKGLKTLGAEITIDKNGGIIAKAKRLIGERIYLDFPSVGATENLMMAAVLAKGTTIIENAAQEPEIVDLGNFLNALGGKVYGQGTRKITIDGVESLKGGKYSPIYDRIEAGTFMIAAAITGSTIRINGVNEDYCRPLIEKLKECGVEFVFLNNGYSAIVNGKSRLRSVDIKTMPYPGFPTDMQSQMMSLLCLVNGSSIITETVFENRFMNVDELIRMGAHIKVVGRTAFVEGVDKLLGCKVQATDLRAGAALVLASLAAEGTSIVTDVFHIDRGYVNIENKLKGIGADIRRIAV